MERNLIKIAFVLLLILTALYAKDCRSLYPEGLPTQSVDKVLCKKEFVIGYSFNTKTPMWAVERLSKTDSTEPLPLDGFRFKRDYALSRKDRASSSDYAYTIQDRSPLVPFEDVNTDHAASNDSFLMSNIAPQNYKLNRYGWIYLERGVRELADVYEEVHVVTGVAFLHQKHEKIERIGTHKVAVPTYYYKAVYAPHTADGPKMWAWLVPNKAIDYKDIKNYRTSVDALEKILDINLFPELSASLQAHVESKIIPL